MSRFVIDASVVLCWCFPDERADLASAVADLFKRGFTALAPPFWPHEILNALLAGQRRKRISSALTRSFLADLSLLPVELPQQPSHAVFDRLQSLSRKHGLTVYDAAYLDLALEAKLPLASLDGDLIRACKAEHVKVVS